MNKEGRRILKLVLILLLPPLNQTADIMCQTGQFMPEKQHSLRQCHPCTTLVNSKLEVLVSPCNRTHDTEIECIDGYYRTQPSYSGDRGRCQKCTECQFPKRQCLKWNDTVCCPGEDYGVYINQAGHAECVLECRPGQLLDPVNKRCLPCPQDTYMDENKHVNIYCKNCERPNARREITVEPCNSTHPTVIECASGYSGRTNSADQGECLKLCGRGEYLKPETETCLTCHENTYMDEDQHIFTDRCRQCESPQSEKEKILRPCNSTHPALIGCVDGFYRRLSDDLSTHVCAQCRDCSKNTNDNIYEGRPCSDARNTVCCAKYGMTVVEGLDGPVCVFMDQYHEVSSVAPTCDENEYLFTGNSSYPVTCVQCPRGTYLNKTEHTNNSCVSCEEFPNDEYCSEDEEGDGYEGSNSVVITAYIIAVVILTMTVMTFLISVKRRIRSRIDTTQENQSERQRFRDLESWGMRK